MEFFVQPDDLMTLARPMQRAQPSTGQSAPIDLAVASLARAVEREGKFPRWGINEMSRSN